ncbi:MAG: hypothetical protein DKM23_05150 [Candidatus Melainabacteria bacterium]|nr:MAG: hypothetical protein DKM23_05150 [Candidatus Melainabacteria bacterium]RAI12082.1 MAG: hypothetical protein DKM24_03460 [Candidatus Melainabacteria bacterium]
MEKIRKYYVPILLGLITLFGLELRVAISNCPMWYDEGHSILVAVQQFPFGIDNFLFTKDFQHTPFYFYFLHFWLKIFGTSEILLRFSSVIFGVATIPLTYIVAKKLYKNDKIVGIISAILVAVSPLMIYYSIEVRMYMMVTFLAVLSMNYLLDFDAKGDKKSLIKLLVTNTLIPYLLIGGIVFNIGQAIAYTLYLFLAQKEETEKIRKYLTYRVYQLILLVPYFIIAIYYAYQRSKFIMFHIPSFQFINFVGNVQNFFGAKVGMLFWTQYLPIMIDFLFFVSVVIPIVYFICALIRAFKEKDAKLYMAFLMITIAYVIILISCMLKVIVLVPRYIIFIVPILMILAAVGFSKLKKWHIAIFLIAFTGFSCYYIFKDPAYVITKTNAILDANNYFESKGLDNRDIVYRPFASSVSFIYQTPTSPRCPAFESMHEFRKPYNKLVYDDYQIQAMEQGHVDEVWLNIIQSNNHVSQRYYDFIKKTYLDQVEAGRYIVMIIYGPDNQALAPKEQYRQQFATVEAVHNDRILGSLFRIFDDTKDIFLEQCDLVERVSFNDNTYFLFRKRPYKK